MAIGIDFIYFTHNATKLRSLSISASYATQNIEVEYKI